MHIASLIRISNIVGIANNNSTVGTTVGLKGRRTEKTVGPRNCRTQKPSDSETVGHSPVGVTYCRNNFCRTVDLLPSVVHHCMHDQC